MQEEENVLNAIEERLKMLEKEKNEIENLYGIDEYILNDPSLLKYQMEKTTEFKNTKISTKKFEHTNLPKLEIKKQEVKRIYKTPEIFKDSLKYEPALNDLRLENEFEPSFCSLNNKMESYPYIPKESNLNTYIKYLSEKYIQNYLN
jgi:hypothetical protein